MSLCQKPREFCYVALSDIHDFSFIDWTNCLFIDSFHITNTGTKVIGSYKIPDYYRKA